jgi:hypothetical protein
MGRERAVERITGINHAAANPRATPGSLASEKQREEQGEDEQEEKV